MDLFENSYQNETVLGLKPLADGLRPKSFSDFVGHNAWVGPQTSLIKNLKATGFLPNLILWGPPGTGKTTLAHILSKEIKSQFISLNAVDTGAKELRQVGVGAHDRKVQFQEKTLVFVDEIHRLNRSQQDVLLPFMEKGDISLIGATTENPSYTLTGALLSRSQVIRFEALEEQDLLKILTRAFSKIELDSKDIFCDESTIESLLHWSGGDARRLLSALEILFQDYKVEKKNYPLKQEALFQILKSNPLPYDKSGEAHYDTISAFIKSLRGSDPDAGLYYLARMLDAGEDPVFIARRLVISASEDVGNADPRALGIAVAGLQAVELVGLPEGAINLAQVVTYIASAPKSNRSYLGLNKAKEEVKKSGALSIPKSLRSSKTKMSKNLGYGKGYKYSHDYDKAYMDQQFLPDAIKNEVFYEPSDMGFEKTIKDYNHWRKS